jgi:hypothetical protein
MCLCHPNLPLPSLTISLLSPTDLQRHEKIHVNVLFHVHVMHIWNRSGHNTIQYLFETTFKKKFSLAQKLKVNTKKYK